MNTLNGDNPNPLYYQLMERLKADLQGGIYPVGSRIPPEHELETAYGVSRVTVRRALGELTKDGLLERKQGKGTFVAHPVLHQDTRQVHSFHDVCALNHKIPGTKVLAVHKRAADSADRQDLGLDSVSEVVEVIRVQSADGVPVILETNHFSLAFSWLTEAELGGSLYRLLSDYGITVSASQHDIALVRADANQAEVLQVEEGSPLLQLHEVMFDQRGRPLHNSMQYIRGDLFPIKI